MLLLCGLVRTFCYGVLRFTDRVYSSFVVKIYLLRHGKAEAGYPDVSRVLADRGRRQAHALGCFLRGQVCFRPVVVWCSPLTRAIETADCFLQAWGGVIESRSRVDALEPERDPAALLAELGALGRDVLLVGHNPNLETLASLLISGERRRARLCIKTGVLLCLDWQEVPHFGQTGPVSWRGRWIHGY